MLLCYLVCDSESKQHDRVGRESCTSMTEPLISRGAMSIPHYLANSYGNLQTLTSS